jgi:hypothetical protein
MPSWRCGNLNSGHFYRKTFDGDYARIHPDTKTGNDERLP